MPRRTESSFGAWTTGRLRSKRANQTKVDLTTRPIRVTTALPPQPILVEDEKEAGSNDRKGILNAGRAAAGTETRPTQYMVMTVAGGPVNETAQEGKSQVRKTKKEEGRA